VDAAGAAAADAGDEPDPVAGDAADVSLPGELDASLEELDPSADLAAEVLESLLPSVLAAAGLALP
jgi:hypothetical protein